MRCVKHGAPSVLIAFLEIPQAHGVPICKEPQSVFTTHLPLDTHRYLLLFNCWTCHSFVFLLGYKHPEIKDCVSSLVCLTPPTLTSVHSPRPQPTLSVPA